jgi:hypothetical protein
MSKDSDKIEKLKSGGDFLAWDTAIEWLLKESDCYEQILFPVEMIAPAAHVEAKQGGEPAVPVFDQERTPRLGRLLL